MQAHILPPSTQLSPYSTTQTNMKRSRVFAGTRHKRQAAISQGNYFEAAGQRAATAFVLVAILKEPRVVNANVNMFHVAPPPPVKPKLAPLVTAGTGERTTPLPSTVSTAEHPGERSAGTTANSAAIARLDVPRFVSTLCDSPLPLVAASPCSLTPTATLPQYSSSLLGSSEPTPLPYHKMSHGSDASSTLTPGKHIALERNAFLTEDTGRKNDQRQEDVHRTRHER